MSVDEFKGVCDQFHKEDVINVQLAKNIEEPIATYDADFHDNNQNPNVDGVGMSTECHKILKIHMNEKPNVSNKCAICDKSFKSKPSLAAHMRVHAAQQPKTKEPILCDICGKSFNKYAFLKIHLRVHTGEKPYRCDICGCTFSQRPHLRAHMTRHSNDRPYMCDTCGKSFKTYSIFQKHKRTHQKRPHARQHSSNACSEQFDAIKQFKKHFKLLHGYVKKVRPYECKNCAKCYTTEAMLNSHLITCLSEMLFLCDICQRKFLWQSELVIHKMIHLDKPDRRCEVCGETFENERQFEKHVKLHLSYKPFKCTMCDKVFKFKFLLLLHYRVHFNEKPYACTFCSKSFKQSPHLITHLRLHNNEKPFTCHVCGKAFRDKGNLSCHVKLHDPDRQFKCSICPKGFVVKRDLQRHYSQCHHEQATDQSSLASLRHISKPDKSLGRETSQATSTIYFDNTSKIQMGSTQFLASVNYNTKPVKSEDDNSNTYQVVEISNIMPHSSAVHGDSNDSDAQLSNESGASTDATDSDMEPGYKNLLSLTISKADCTAFAVQGTENPESSSDLLKMSNITGLQKSLDCAHKTEDKSNIIQLKSVDYSINVSSGNCDAYIANVGEHFLDNSTETQLNPELLQVSNISVIVVNQQPTPACPGTSNLINKTITCNASFAEKDSEKEGQTALLAVLEGMEDVGQDNGTRITCNDNPPRAEVGKSGVLGNVDSGFDLIIETSQLLEHGAGDACLDPDSKLQSGTSANSTQDCMNNIALNANNCAQNTGHNPSSFISRLDANIEFFLPVDEKSGKSAASVQSKPVDVTSTYQADGSIYKDKTIYNTMTLTYTDVMTDHADKLSHPGDDLSDNQLSTQQKSCIVLIDQDAKCSSSSTADLSSGDHVNCDEAEESPALEQTKRVKDDIIWCVECDEQFSHASYAHQHMAQHASGIRFACGICGNSFSKAIQLSWHKRQHGNGRKQLCSCTVCGQTLTRLSHLKMHMRTHSGERPYACGICHKRFVQHAHLNTHMLTHTGERRHLCATCGKSFALPDGLRKHEDTVHYARKRTRTHPGYLCEVCSKMCSSLGALRIHKQRIHLENGKPRRPYTIQSSDRMQQLFSCDICLKAYTTLSAKELHKQHVHSQPCTLQCSVCLQDFRSKTILNNHLVQVHKKKPFNCHYCPKSFLFNQVLKTHLMSHTGEKPYKCELCNKMFRQQHHLKTHMLLHTGERPYACGKCGKRFSNTSNQRNHEKTHLAVKPYACSLCSRAYVVKRDLMRHQQAHHSH